MPGGWGDRAAALSDHADLHTATPAYPAPCARAPFVRRKGRVVVAIQFLAMTLASSPTSTSRVVIVGGGIIGCMTAYYLTRAGVSDVVVVEREGVASGASGYSAGMLTPYSGSNDPGLLALSSASLKLHAELAEELPEVTGIDHGYDMVPYLRCTFAESGYNEARKFMEDRVADGLDAEWLTGEEARSVCDWLSDEVEGACLTSIEPSVDSRLLTQSVLKAAETGGARLVDGEVVGIAPFVRRKGREQSERGMSGGVMRGDDVLRGGHPPASRSARRVPLRFAKGEGVVLADGSSIEADVVVLAMGPWSKDANSWLGYEIPVEPQKGELLYMYTGEGHPKPPVTMHNMDDGGVIFPRRLSPTILGATKEDGKGYDRVPSDYAWEFIIPRVQRLSPRIDRSVVSHQTACLRPMPSDGKPYVGLAPGWDNVYIASGHWSEGVHYGPLTGKSIAELITDGTTSADISAIDVGRLVNDGRVVP